MTQPSSEPNPPNQRRPRYDQALTEKVKVNVHVPAIKRKRPPAGQPIGDCHMPCQGSEVVHPAVFLRVFRGASGVLFARCPLPDCKFMAFYAGPGFKPETMGLTLSRVREINPNALIL